MRAGQEGELHTHRQVHTLLLPSLGGSNQGHVNFLGRKADPEICFGFWLNKTFSCFSRGPGLFSWEGKL